MNLYSVAKYAVEDCSVSLVFLLYTDTGQAAHGAVAT